LSLFPERDPDYDLVEVAVYGNYAAARLAADILSKAGLEAIVPEPVYPVLAECGGLSSPVRVLRCDSERAKALLAEVAPTFGVEVSEDELTRQALAEAPPEDAVE